MAELRELSVNQFVEETASKASVPGGGSVSAMVGALGASLMEMVANLTIGKEKYAGVQEEMQALAAEGAALHEELLAGIKKDSESFNGYKSAEASEGDGGGEKNPHCRPAAGVKRGDRSAACDRGVSGKDFSYGGSGRKEGQ